MNKGFANFVFRRWYLLIIIWIILLIISAPLSTLFFKLVSYQVAISTPGSTSAKAESIVAKYFHLKGAGEAGAVLVINGNVTPYSLFLSNLTSYGNISLISYYTIEKSLLNQTLTSLRNATENLTTILENISSQERTIEYNLSKEYVNLTQNIQKLEELNNGTEKVENEFINVSQEINDTAQKLELLHYSMLNNLTAFEKIAEGEKQVNSSARNVSLFLFAYPSYFLQLFQKYYQETGNFTYSSEEAFIYVNSTITSQEEREYFYAFYHYWISINQPNFLQRAEYAIVEASKLLNNTFVNLVLEFVNITNFQEEYPYEELTITYMNETYHVPIFLARQLYVLPPQTVLLNLYSEKTGLNETFLYYVLTSNSTQDFLNLSYNLLIEKVPPNATQFITTVFYNLTESPYVFAVKYISSTYNVSESLLEKVSNFTTYSQFVNFVASQASQKTKLPSWVFSQLIYYNNTSNITAYLVSTKITKLYPLLNASKIAPKQFALEVENATNRELYNLSSLLISNYVKFPAIVSVNRSELAKVLSMTYNISISTIVNNLISNSEFPVSPISNITTQLYSKGFYLILMTGNFTYKEAEEFQSYISSKVNLPTYLTGNKPISNQLKSVASEAFAVAIPVGIILAIIITGIYFRSFVAAFVPLGIYGAAYLVSSAVNYLIVIKLLGITVDFLTPSQMLLLALGLGTDYVVFISSRYIEERRKGKSKEAAVEEAIIWGGKAVTLTALVVMLSFLFLYVYNVPLVSDTSISEMLAVIVVWLTAITLFTVILRVTGDKLFFPRKLTPIKNDKSAKISRPGVKVGVITLVVLIFAAIAITTPLSLNVLALLPKSQATAALDVLDQEFTSNNVFPIFVVVNMTSYNFTYQEYQYASNIYHNLASIQGVTAVESPVSPYGSLIPYENLSDYNYTQYLSHGYMLFIVNQKYQPFSTEAFNIVQKIESMKIGYVGGGPVDAYNILHFVETEFAEIVLLIAVTMFVILIILTRSIAVSSVILFTIFAAVAITLGLEKLLFTSLGYEIFAVVPLFLVAIIIGIGMDYNIFLISRVHEELEKGENMEEAVSNTVKSIGVTIIFLGLIFAGTLGSLLLVNAAILQEIGFALAIAAILETSVLWYYLAPSLLVLLYRRFRTRPKIIV